MTSALSQLGQSSTRLSYGDDSITFQILGKLANSSVEDNWILNVYQNAGNTIGDAINYRGLMTEDENIVNKKFIDDNFLPYDLSTLPTLP